MTIERQQADILVVTVVLSNGLTYDHRYVMPSFSSQGEFERFMDLVLRQPHETLVGLNRLRGIVMNNPWAIYNVAHVMGLRIRGEGSAHARQLADQVPQLGFLARDRSG